MDINLDQNNIKLWVQDEEIEISIKLLEEFMNMFVKNEANYLCQELINKWNIFLGKCINKKISPINVNLPQSISSYLPNDTKQAGVYSIFGRHVNSAKPTCFYVGMSASSEKLGHSSSIRKRLSLHLNKDLDPKGQYGISGFKGCFYWLRQCSEIFICWAKVEANERNDNLRNNLELLELCLGAKLQALYLLGSNLQRFTLF